MIPKIVKMREIPLTIALSKLHPQTDFNPTFKRVESLICRRGIVFWIRSGEEKTRQSQL